MSRYTFGKKEKLCSKKEIDALFASGRSLKQHPLRLIYLALGSNDVPAKALISVPKKRFSKAVSRNRIKRIIREAYRLNKPDLMKKWEVETKCFALAFVYIGDSIPTYGEVDEAMKRLLEKLRTI